MTRKLWDLAARIALLLVIAWQSYLINHYHHSLRDMNTEMQKATAQMNEDVAAMNRLRKACGIQQTSLEGGVR